jgi:hypothetical protein
VLSLDEATSDLPQARHTVGLDHPAPLHQQSSIHFFELRPAFTTHHPPHNRVLCEQSPTGLAISHKAHRVMDFRASGSGESLGDTRFGEVGGCKSHPVCCCRQLFLQLQAFNRSDSTRSKLEPLHPLIGETTAGIYFYKYPTTCDHRASREMEDKRVPPPQDRPRLQSQTQTPDELSPKNQSIPS